MNTKSDKERRNKNSRTFYHRHKNEPGRREAAKIRTTKHRLKHKYGLSEVDYKNMQQLQGGVCAICLQPEHHIDGRYDTPVRLSVDHDNVTGRVRALLCRDCNRGIGSFKENIDLLGRAYEYLKKFI